MENLIPNQKGMTSLEIAEVTSKQHAHVMRDIRSLLSQGVSASNFGLGSYTDANGQKRPLFNLTPKGCLILASGYDAVLRERIINRLEYLENEKKVIKTPQTYLEALEALVASEKEKEQLRIETEQQQKQIEQKDARITKLQPKADFAEAAFKAEGKVDIGQAAKILNLGFGRNTLFGKLRDAGIFFKDRNEPKQKYIDAGYFEMTLLPPIRRDNHPDILCQKVFCKPKGLAYINHLFGGKPSDRKISPIKQYSTTTHICVVFSKFAENEQVMERIKLTKEEKQAFRIVAEFGGKCPATYPKHVFTASIRSIERKGLVKANYVIGGYVWSAKLTEEGKHYLAVNPNLHNPINWNLILAIVGVFISIIALFVSCMKKY